MKLEFYRNPELYKDNLCSSASHADMPEWFHMCPHKAPKLCDLSDMLCTFAFQIVKKRCRKNQFHLIMLGWILENTGSMTILETMMNNYIYICTCTVFGGFTMFCLWHLGKKTQKNWVAIKLKSVRNIQHEPLQTWNGVPRYQLSPVQNTFSTGCFCMKEQTENLIFG